MTMNTWSSIRMEQSSGSPACLQFCNPMQPLPVRAFPTNNHNNNNNNNNTSEKEDMDALLSEGMSRLTFEELQQEQEDLHGVSATISEEKVEVNILLANLDEHLNGMKMGTAYASAESLNREFVKDYDFRMMFLRANRYNPKAAAKQIISFLEVKLKLFGLEKLTKEITLKDLTAEDKRELLTGSMQLLPFTDRSGRKVALEMSGLRTGKSPLGELRARFYYKMNAIRSMEIPSRGLVVVCYAVGGFRETRESMRGSGFVENTKLALAMPFHVAGIHICTNNATEALVSKAAIAVIPDTLRSKTKIHLGSHQECQYLLSTFGIPREMMPFTVNNELVLDNHLIWYQDCVDREKESTVEAPRDPNKNEPNKNDVVFIGRKTKGNGNEYLRDSAVRYSGSYYAGSPREKREIVDSMVADIKRRGGRFLKQDSNSGLWKEVPITEVREKITQMFRNLRRTKGSQQRGAVAGPMGQRIFVDEPSDHDVLFGRQPSQSGNQRLRELVEGMALEYDAANRGKKKKLADSLVQEIKGTGGRFLKPIDDGRWEEVSDVAAGIKIATHFRNYRRYQKTPKDALY